MTRSNPFESFAAGSSSSGSSWMTTKKRGRDDDEISRDAQLTKEARKDKSSRRRSSGTKVAATATSLKAKGRGGRNSKKSKPTSRSSSGSRNKPKDFDSDDEDDSFIASDEEEVEESDEEEEADFDEESDEEENELILHDSDGGDDNDSDDGNDDDSILESSPEKPKRTRLNQNQLQLKGAGSLSSTRKNSESTANSRGNRGRLTVRTKKNPRKTKSIVTLDDSSSDDSIGTNNKIAAKKSTKPSRNVTHVFSSDSEDLETGPFQAMAKKKKNTNEVQRTTSKFFAKKTESSPAIQRSRKKTASKNSFLSDSDDDYEEKMKSQKSATVAPAPKSKSMSLGAAALAEINLTDTDDDNDEDNALNEALALSTAMEASRKSFDKSKSKTIYKDDIEQEEDEDEDEDEDNADEIEAYEDENEQEASNVLESANNLSAHILSAMTKWFQGDSNSNNEVVPKGMILDGALSLSSLQKKKEMNKVDGEEKKDDENDGFASGVIGENDANWISQETMQQICPQIILKDYQLIGVNWMALLNRLTFGLDAKDRTSNETKKKKKGGTGRNVNGVLADEMGLGKTVQTIAFLAWLKYRTSGTATGESDAIELDDKSEEDVDQPQCPLRDNHKPHIIIVPASVLDNWMNEFEKFCPTMNVIKYHGSMKQRQELKSDLRKYLPKGNASLEMNRYAKPLDVVVTTFSYFSNEKGDDRSFLRKFDWNYMVVDEAHCLKNPRGMRYKNMDCFKTERRLLLTGTPVQNSPKELMSLLCFLMPLFTRNVSSFDEDASNDGGERMLEHFVRLEEVNGKKKSMGTISHEEAYQKLKLLFAPFVLRRSKDDLGNVLPPKKHVVQMLPFDDSVRRIYNSIIENHMKSKQASQAARSHLFTQLRKAANHTLLLRNRHQSPEAIEHLSKSLFVAGYFGYDATCTQTLVKKELELFSDYDIHCAALSLIEDNRNLRPELGKYLLQESDLFCSPKFARIQETLPKMIEQQHRVLIFSQWTRCLDLLGCLMEAMSIRFTRLDGQTNIEVRQTLIDQFNNDSNISVFLLSTRAGGMGINLTAADTVILHDLDFNPFNDLQAENRVHRFGQTKPVTIIKMITEDTVDADIYKMQQRKAKMNAAIMDSKTKAKDKKTDAKEIKAILDMAVSRYSTK
eukprot:CAMPEP_0194085366 /NCGR_PEP_ID=MMETSP0149-20130528/17372_1 /TAXON_ID=122233 /ORGANISM="Chaetoceros debilis, Strain MM31A-1" /LENGTH=1145 /DNA_ID=CAMNT_0038768237 /DNA_START=83 /DNA_END=3520 /DNA_ORIENTATION=+